MKKLLLIAGTAVLVVGLLSLPAYAVVRSDDTIIVGADEVIDDDFFAAGSEVIIEGTVNGDVYVGANRLSVRGTVNGDVIAGAQTIEITGTITEDLRAGGNNISLVGATIGDSVTVGGNELSIDGDSSVGGGLVFGGRLLSLDGSIGRGIISGGETARVGGSAGRTVRLAANSVEIGESAVIEGNLEYNSDNQAEVEGTVTGDIVRSDSDFSVDTENLLRVLTIGFTVWAFVGAAIIGGVMLLLLPGLFKRANRRFMEKPWTAAGYGTIAVLMAIPAFILLLITIVGIPMAVLLIIFWLTAIYMAKFFAAYSVGSWLARTFNVKKGSFFAHSYTMMLIGLLLYYALRTLPFVGVLVRLSTTVVGIGIIIMLLADLRNGLKAGK